MIAADIQEPDAQISVEKMPLVRGFFDPATATWTYVVWAEENSEKENRADDKKCAIIDSVLDYDAAAGRTSTAGADRVLYFIESKGLSVDWILETHIHADHLTAARYMKQRTGGKTGISKHILDVLKTWAPVFDAAKAFPLDGSQFDHLFEDDETFNIGSLEARIIHTPGHTPADTSYIIGQAVFVGDAMFLPDVGAGRCDFPGGSAADSYDSTRKLLALPEETRLYVGHDYPPPDAAGRRRAPQCMATVAEQRAANIRAHAAIKKEAFIAERDAADKDKPMPELLLPSLQVNLRAGEAGDVINIPVNKI